MPEPAEKPSLHSYLRERYGSSTQKLVREHERSLHRRARCNNHHIFNMRCRDEGVVPSSLEKVNALENRISVHPLANIASGHKFLTSYDSPFQ